MSNELLTTAEAAGLLGVSISTVTRMARRGDLPFIRKLPGNNGLLFDRTVVEMLVRQLAKAAAS